jgi:hypothetical protein
LKFNRESWSEKENFVVDLRASSRREKIEESSADQLANPNGK